MRGRWRMLLLLLCACKAEIGGNPADPDAAIDATVVDAVDAVGTFGPWSAPMMLPGASATGIGEDDGTLSNSKLELIFSKADPAIDAGRKHLYWMTRTSVTATTWSIPMRLPINLDGTSDETPRFSADDKTLFFASNRAGTTGALDIWQTTRTTIGTSTWSPPTLVGTINSAQTDKWCVPCSLGKYLMVSTRNNPTTPSEDIYEGTSGGGAPTLVAELSDLANTDNGPFITADCKTMYFASNRSGAQRIYTSTRATSTSPWPPPQPLPDFVNVGIAQEDPWISEDGKTFVFSATTTAGNKDVYITTR